MTSQWPLLNYLFSNSRWGAPRHWRFSCNCPTCQENLIWNYIQQSERYSTGTMFFVMAQYNLGRRLKVSIHQRRCDIPHRPRHSRHNSLTTRLLSQRTDTRDWMQRWGSLQRQDIRRKEWRLETAAGGGTARAFFFGSASVSSRNAAHSIWFAFISFYWTAIKNR